MICEHAKECIHTCRGKRIHVKTNVCSVGVPCGAYKDQRFKCISIKGYLTIKEILMFELLHIKNTICNRYPPKLKVIKCTIKKI